jgi:hypothetical protein
MSQITLFKNIKETESPVYVDTDVALERIRTGGKHRQIISSIRTGQTDLKKQLPIALWSGKFSERKDSALQQHSGLIVLDFDHIEVEGSKNILATDDYIYACWISPSGEGLKALVHISSPENHRDHFRALQAYFDNQYGLEADPSGVNESRACFDSYDKDIVVKKSAVVFSKMISEKALNQKAEQRDTYTDYNKLAIVSSMIRKSEDGEKHAMLLRASILCGGYISAGRMEEDEAIRILEREITRRDIDSIETARQTIRDGLEKGKTMPIREVIDGENKAKLEMMINDGDMSFISSDDEDLRWIQDFKGGKLEVGLGTGDSMLDEYFKYKREFLIINGLSNVGKTTLALFMMVNASIRHDWKWIVYSAENKTASIKMKLMQFALNLKVSDMTNSELDMAYRWVAKHFKIISNKQIYSYTDLIVFGEKLLRQDDYDGFFIDPYNALKIQMSAGNNLSTHEYHYEAASELLTFSNKHNIAVWLNAHAVTEAQRRKGDDGLPIAPYAEDTEGGGKFVNRADCFLTFHRKVQHSNYDIRRTMELHVRKVREVETGGMPTPIDRPILFEMGQSDVTFINKLSGNRLFNSIGVNKNYNKIELPLDVHDVF